MKMSHGSNTSSPSRGTPLLAEARMAVTAVLSLAVLLCGIYPLMVWITAHALFPTQANGSLLKSGGQVLGSSLIGQSFSGARYFHPRPSSAGTGYDATLSGGSNLGPTSRGLMESVSHRVIAYRNENGLSPDTPVPADAVTASASGLDPHISPANAALQALRVARARDLPLDAVQLQVAEHTESRDLGVFGEPRVNVLELNLALDRQP